MPRPPSTAETMVAKLSSVRIMSAASFVTSVPVIPIATPMSARLSAGASLTPSPVIETTLPLRFRTSTRRTLSSGATRATTPILADLLPQLLVGQRCELRARQRSTLDSELSGDGGRGRRVVAGDHAGANPRLLAARDRVPCLLARRVDYGDESEQRQTLHLVEQYAVGTELVRIDVARGHGEHAHSLAGETVVLGQNAIFGHSLPEPSSRRRLGSATSARAARRVRP